MHKPAECLTFGSAYTNAYPLAGMKIFAVDSDFDESNAISAMVEDSVEYVLESYGCLSDYSSESVALRLTLLDV